MLHRVMLIESIGIRLMRSTSRPTGIVKIAPTRSETAVNRPIFVLPMWSECSSCGATEPTVALSAPLSARTAPNIVITRARAGPPTRLTTSPRTSPAVQRVTRTVTRHVPAAASRPVTSWMLRSARGQYCEAASQHAHPPRRRSPTPHEPFGVALTFYERTFAPYGSSFSPSETLESP